MPYPPPRSPPEPRVRNAWAPSSGKGRGGARTATLPPPMFRAFLTELPTRLFTLHGDRIGGLAVNRVIAHRQLRLTHAQRHEDPDHFEDDERGDGIVDDDERRAID